MGRAEYKIPDMPPWSLSTCRTEGRYGLRLRLVTSHTTEAKLKKHIFSEPARVPSIPDKAIKITPKFICPREKTCEYRAANSRSMSCETTQETLHRDTARSRVLYWQCCCMFLQNNLFTCIIHQYSDRVRTTKCNAIGPLEKVAQGRGGAGLTS